MTEEKIKFPEEIEFYTNQILRDEIHNLKRLESQKEHIELVIETAKKRIKNLELILKSYNPPS